MQAEGCTGKGGVSYAKCKLNYTKGGGGLYKRMGELYKRRGESYAKVARKLRVKNLEKQ